MKKLKRYLPVALWCLVIFLFSSLETTPTPKDTLLNFILKKTAHIIEYAVLYWLTFEAVNHPEVCDTSKASQKSQARRWNYRRWKYRKLPRTPNCLGPLIFTILYAISDEIHQSFVPGRHAHLYDIGFDFLGALIARHLITSQLEK